MRFFASKIFRRVSLVTLSVLLSISSLSAAMPFFLSENAFADSQIALTSLIDGQSWAAGSVHTIKWNGHNSINEVDLEYALNGDSSSPTWNLIATNLPSESYTWTVPNISVTSSHARILVKDSTSTAANHQDISSDFTITAAIDTVAPSSPVANPVAGTYTTAQSVALSAVDNVNGSGFKAIYYTTDGSTPTNTSSTYAAPIGVNASETIKAIAYDNAGNPSTVSSFSYVINIDTTPPVATVSYSSLIATKDDVTATLTATEAIQASTLPGWTQVSSTKYTKIYTSNASEIVIFKDLAGNSGSVSVSISNIDKNAPTTPNLVAPTPTGNATLSTGTFLLDWSDATDGTGSGVSSYEYQAAIDPTTSNGVLVNPIYNQGSLTSSEIQASGTLDGTYYWQVRAIDGAGNVGSWSAVGKVTVDATAPTAQFTFPSRGPSATSFEVTFSEAVNAADATNPANYFLKNWPGAGGDGDLAGNAVVVYNAAAKTATVTFTNPFWYVSGEQKWGVKNIRDLAGNVLLETTAYSTPLTAPTVPGTPTTSTPTNGLTSNWTWAAATDLPDPAADASGVKGYQYQFTNGSAIITGWTNIASTSVTTTAPSAGTYQLHVRAFDNAGSPAGPESVGTVVIDQMGPTVAISTLTNGLVFGNHAPVAITGTTGDAISYTLSIGKTGGTPLATDGGTSFTSYNWDTTNVATGSYIATLVGTDAAGNSTKSEVVIAIDNDGPASTVAGGTYATLTPTLTGTVDADAVSVNVFVLDSANNVIESGLAAYVAGNTNWSYTVQTGLTDGATYTILAIAKDVFGNPSSTANTGAAQATVAIPVPAAPATTSTPTTTITPIITSPGAAAVLGATTGNSTTGDVGVKGVTDQLAAAAVNSEANKGTIFGIAWYWWILILAALALIGWFITGAIRRRNEEQA